MSKKKTFKEFLKEARAKHGEKYDYSKVNWVDSHTPIEIVCPVHGSFIQLAKRHTSNGCGCNKCAIEYRAKLNCKKTEDFIASARKKHGDLYDYSKSIYTRSHDDIIIICPKHGEFIQKAYLHLNGEGCPICRNSHLENEIRNLLDDMHIKYEQHYHTDFLGKLELDFFIPEKNIGIECQGKQHFGAGGWGDGFSSIFENDRLKKRLCEENNVKLIYYGRRNYFKNINSLYDDICFNLNDVLEKIC